MEVKDTVPNRRFYELQQLPPSNGRVRLLWAGRGRCRTGLYGAIRRWMQVRGDRLAGAKREIHLDGMLEIQFPLKSA